MTDYVFDWDPAKDTVNQRKHGVPFRLAARAFDDPLHVSEMDRIEGGEYRWKTIGRVDNATLLLVAHTWIDEEGTTLVRIISARRARPSERRRYEN